MSGDTCQMSDVRCQVSGVIFFFFFSEKVVGLVGGGSVKGPKFEKIGQVNF